MNLEDHFDESLDLLGDTKVNSLDLNPNKQLQYHKLSMASTVSQSG